MKYDYYHDTGKFIGFFYGVSPVLAKYPEGDIGDYFLNGETCSIWMWDAKSGIWIDTNRLDSGLQQMLTDDEGNSPSDFVPSPSIGIKEVYFYVAENGDCDNDTTVSPRDITFTYFKNGNSSVSVQIRKTSIIILYWNGDYWETNVVPLNVDLSPYAKKTELQDEVARAQTAENENLEAINTEIADRIAAIAALEPRLIKGTLYLSGDSTVIYSDEARNNEYKLHDADGVGIWYVRGSMIVGFLIQGWMQATIYPHNSNYLLHWTWNSEQGKWIWESTPKTYAVTPEEKSKWNYAADQLKDFLESTDATDSAINKWKELENFLAGITDTDTLSGMLYELETRINSNIYEESERATEVENILKNDLQEESERAVDAENLITNNLQEEIARATNAESLITYNLQEETARAKKEEEKLQNDKIGKSPTYTEGNFVVFDAEGNIGNSEVNISNTIGYATSIPVPNATNEGKVFLYNGGPEPSGTYYSGNNYICRAYEGGYRWEPLYDFIIADAITTSGSMLPEGTVVFPINTSMVNNVNYIGGTPYKFTSSGWQIWRADAGKVLVVYTLPEATDKYLNMTLICKNTYDEKYPPGIYELIENNGSYNWKKISLLSEENFSASDKARLQNLEDGLQTEISKVGEKIQENTKAINVEVERASAAETELNNSILLNRTAIESEEARAMSEEQKNAEIISMEVADRIAAITALDPRLLKGSLYLSSDSTVIYSDEARKQEYKLHNAEGAGIWLVRGSMIVGFLIQGWTQATIYPHNANYLLHWKWDSEQDKWVWESTPKTYAVTPEEKNKWNDTVLRLNDFLDSAGMADSAINKWNDIENFLAGIENTETLTEMLLNQETTLRTTISEETSRATAAEASLSESVASNKTAIESEEARAKSEEQKNAEIISMEVADRISAITALDPKLLKGTLYLSGDSTVIYSDEARKQEYKLHNADGAGIWLVRGSMIVGFLIQGWTQATIYPHNANYLLHWKWDGEQDSWVWESTPKTYAVTPEEKNKWNEAISRLNNFIGASDTSDSEINSWTELENFLTGISDTDTLTGLLYELETNLNEDISAETSRATTAEQSLQSSIDSLLANKSEISDIDMDEIDSLGNMSISGTYIVKDGAKRGILLFENTGNNSQRQTLYIDNILKRRNRDAGGWGEWNTLVDFSNGFATVATSGSYSDLSNLPALSTVATSGSYNDLKNCPSLSTVAVTGNYESLSSKPLAGSLTLVGADNLTQSYQNGIYAITDGGMTQGLLFFSTAGTGGLMQYLLQDGTIKSRTGSYTGSSAAWSDWQTVELGFSDYNDLLNKPVQIIDNESYLDNLNYNNTSGIYAVKSGYGATLYISTTTSSSTYIQIKMDLFGIAYRHGYTTEALGGKKWTTFVHYPWDWDSTYNNQYPSDLNNFTEEGIYFVKGTNDKATNLPITNTGETINVAFTLLVSVSKPITMDDGSSRAIIGQNLTLANRIGGENKQYLRHAIADTKNGATTYTWGAWKEVLTQTLLGSGGICTDSEIDAAIDNGIYSGVTSQSGILPAYSTFTMVVVNNYAATAAASAMGVPSDWRQVTQTFIAVPLSTDGQQADGAVYMRTGMGGETISWGELKQVGGEDTSLYIAEAQTEQVWDLKKHPNWGCPVSQDIQSCVVNIKLDETVTHPYQKDYNFILTDVSSGQITFHIDTEKEFEFKKLTKSSNTGFPNVSGNLQDVGLNMYTIAPATLKVYFTGSKYYVYFDY